MKKNLLALCVIAATFVNAQTIQYITQTGAGLKDGSSWANAGDSSQVQSFINAAVGNTEVWLASGVYKPNAYPLGCVGCATNRDYAFVLKNNVALYGSFAGNETSVSQRDLSTINTFFDGDIGVIDTNTDNCHHILIAIKTDRTASLDGIEIRNGNASGANNITINNKIITRYDGGGIYADTSSLSISNCIVRKNNAIGYAGGIRNRHSISLFVNSGFYNNTLTGSASDGGGAYYTDLRSNDTIISCVFSNNSARDYGGGAIKYGGNGILCISNSVFSANSAPISDGGAIDLTNDTVTIFNCVFYKNTCYYNGAAIDNSGGWLHIYYTTFSGDLGVSPSNAIRLTNNARGYIYNSIMYPYTSNGTTTYATDGTSSFNVIATFLPSSGNPQFKNYNNGIGPDGIWKTTDDGLRPICTSPLIGLPLSGIGPTPTLDISGYSRSGTAERGAYEILDSTYSPLCSISATKTTICSTDSVTFTLNLLNNFQYSNITWKKNLTTVLSGINATTYTASNFTNNDSIVCEVTSSETCAPGTATSNRMRITVIPVTTPNITISTGSTSVCVNSNAAFTAAATGTGANPTYQWFQNGNQVGNNNNTYTVNSVTTGFSISCILNDTSLCATKSVDTSNTISVTVNQLVTPTVGISANDSSICAGTTVIFTRGSTNGGGSPSYVWLKNGVSTGFSGNPYVTSNLIDNDQISIRMTSSLTCVTQQTVTSSAVTISVLPLPSATITPSGSTNLCPGQSVTLSVVSGNTYLWSSSETTSSITVNQTGAYRVTVTSANGCSAVSSNINVAVISVATPTITQNGNILSSSASTGNQWFLNGNPVGGATGQNYTPTQNGNYTVSVTDGNGCSSSLSNGINFISSGIEEFKQDNISVYPNPATNQLNINLGSLQAEQVSIYNVNGKLVSETQQPANNGIDISTLANGVYIAEVKVRGAVQRVRWVKM